MRTVALDLGGRKTTFCEIANGIVKARATVSELEALLPLIGPNTPRAWVAFEACREAWRVADQVEQWGHIPIMVDTTRVRALGIGQHGRKNDRIDAEVLARALAERRIPKAHILSPHRRELRFHLQIRYELVKTRARYVSQIREIVRASQKRLPGCAVEHFTQTLTETPLAPKLRILLQPLAQLLPMLDEQILQVEARLLQLCQQEPMILNLATAPGVSLIIAAAFVSVVDTPHRFPNAHELESYLGLVPCENTTGGGKRHRLGSITKKGNSYLRALLVQGSQSILRSRQSDDPLVQWGQATAARRSHNIAVVATARKLAGILWAIWRTESFYDPQRLAAASQRGLQSQADDLNHRAEALRTAQKKLSRYGRIT